MNQSKIFAFLDALAVGQRLAWKDDPRHGTYLGNRTVRWDDGWVWAPLNVDDLDVDFLHLVCDSMTTCGDYSPTGCECKRSLQLCPEPCKQTADEATPRVPLLVSVGRLLQAA